MSRAVFTPSNQQRLTNVSVVRLKKGGTRFEIACYKNKVSEWRARVETDIDSVLQTHAVYTNVSKGQTAPRDALVKAFGTEDTEKIVLEILQKGELQVGEKERGAQTEALSREIAALVAQKCVNPATRRPYPYSLIEKAMQQDLHYSINLTRPVKQQALDVIKLLQEKQVLPIARAQMRVRIVLPASKEAKKLRERIGPVLSAVEDEDFSNSDSCEITGTVDPGSYPGLVEMISAETRGRGHVEVLTVRDVADGEESL